MIRFYLDENVRGSIRRGLRSRGVDVVAAQEDGYEGIDDPEVLDRARELDRVLFSNDDDMLREATHRQRSGVPFSGVLFAHQQEVSIGECLDDLEVIAFAGHEEEFAIMVRYLPLR